MHTRKTCKQKPLSNSDSKHYFLFFGGSGPLLFSPGSRSPLIPLVASSLFRSSSLTESLEQASEKKLTVMEINMHITCIMRLSNSGCGKLLISEIQVHVRLSLTCLLYIILNTKLSLHMWDGKNNFLHLIRLYTM